MKRLPFTRVLAGIALAVPAAIATYALLIRPWHLTWGATDEEVRRPQPGDELVPDPKLAATHAITIRASAATVWPWLVQIGQGRGGFYSYDRLENLMGLGIYSADRIIPELQNLKVGDVVPLEPGGFGPKVAALEPGSFIMERQMLRGIRDRAEGTVRH